MALNLVGIKQVQDYNKLQDYQLNNIHESAKLFRMTSIKTIVCHKKRMLKKLYKELINQKWMNCGGSSLKGFTFTEKYPPSILSTGDCSISTFGMKQFQKKDLLALDIGELNFAMRQQGKKTVEQQQIFKKKWLTLVSAGVLQIKSCS